MENSIFTRKRRAIIAVLFLIVLCSGAVVYAESKGIKVLSQPREIYEAYQDNHFPLMTGGLDELGKFEGVIASITTTIKEITWSFVRMLGTFNATMVKFMFNLDIVSPLKQAMMAITQSLASNMLSIAGTLGICIVAGAMIYYYSVTSNIKSSIRVFLTTVAIFVGLTAMADKRTNETLFNTVFELDQQINTLFVNVNPVFDNTIDVGKENTADQKLESAGDAIAASIFYANVYEPYLLMNYGTTDQEAIREKGTVQVENQELDRIDGWLSANEEKTKEAILKQEVKSFENKTINHTANLNQAGFAFFYALTNLIQTIIFFIMGFMRIVMSLLQILLMPLLPPLLLFAVFQMLPNAYKNYAKAIGISMIAKGAIGFAMILFASYISLGFTMASKNGNAFEKMLTIIIFVVSPIGLYLFRHIIVAVLTGQVSLKHMPGLVAHPIQTGKNIQNERQNKRVERNAAREKAREDAKKRKEQEQKKREKDGSVQEFKQPNRQKKQSGNRQDIQPRNARKHQDKQNDKDAKEENKSQSSTIPNKKGNYSSARTDTKSKNDPQNKDNKDQNKEQSAQSKTIPNRSQGKQKGRRHSDKRNDISGNRKQNDVKNISKQSPNNRTQSKNRQDIKPISTKTKTSASVNPQVSTSQVRGQGSVIQPSKVSRGSTRAATNPSESKATRPMRTTYRIPQIKDKSSQRFDQPSVILPKEEKKMSIKELKKKVPKVPKFTKKK